MRNSASAAQMSAPALKSVKRASNFEISASSNRTHPERCAFLFFSRIHFNRLVQLLL
jgi:hypothetical protein